tara:strand:- start:144 stop:539 length:396 start_codon:yes stop_codon:yes gene_type:complete
MAIKSISDVIFYEQDGSTVLWNPAVQPNISASYGVNYEGTIVNQAYGGEQYTVQKHGRRYSWVMDWSYLSETERDNADNLLDYADGQFQFFQFTPNGGTDKYSVYFDQNTHEFQEIAFRVFSLSLSFIEKL